VKTASIFSKGGVARQSLLKRLWLPAILIATASLFLMQTGFAFQQRLDDLRIGRSDNRGWIVAQMEVDYLKLLVALDRAVLAARADPDAALPNDIERAVRREFDIFYSRVTIFMSTMQRVQTGTPMQVRLAELVAARNIMAALIDQTATLSDADVEELLTIASSYRALVRDTTVAAVQDISVEAAMISDKETALFQRFYLQTLLLFVLLAYGSFLVVRLWRQLDARTYDASRTAAILSNAFDATLNAVLVIDDKGRLLYLNQIATAMFGLSEEEINHADARDLIRFVDQPPDGGAAIADTSAAGLSGRGMRTGYCRTGWGDLPVELAVVADWDVSGDRIYIYFLRDISDRVSAENDLRHAVKVAEGAAQAKSRFLATMSHEMRTPLHGLMASLSLLDDATLDPKNRALIQTARGCSARAQMQVDDVLELTRLSDSVEDQRPFDVLALVSDIVDELRPLAASSGNRITLVTQGPFADHALQGQVMAFSRTLYNLLGNAVKFTHDGLITLRLTLSGQAPRDLRLMVEVEDTGTGIAPEDLNRIFDYFETLGSSNTSTIAGSGLGLPIAKLAVTQMGGVLQVSSMPDVGSRFHFTIPLQTAEEKAPQILKPQSQTPDQARHVLIVDDNDINLTLMCEMVRRMGHTCALAQNGAEAVEAAANSDFDIILMDFSMPVMDGPTAAAAIRASGGASARARIIGVTAMIVPQAQQAQLTAFDQVLTKPVGLDQLRLAMAQTSDPAAAEDDPGDDPAAAFGAIRDLVGAEQAQKLLQAALADAELALAALADTAQDRGDRIAVIHKSVGSTGMIGMQDLADILSEAEHILRAGDDLADTALAKAGRATLAELRAIYAEMDVI
jgi:PAS domain S-box-containing protein